MIAFLFDTETTGLVDNMTIPLDKQPSIIEFFGHAVNLETGEVLSEIEHLIKPPNPISEEITRITGITNEDLSTCAPFQVYSELIRKAIESYDLVIAHNLSFDREMLTLEFMRLNQELVWPRTLCTVEATVHLLGYRLNLTGLHQHLFGEGFPEAHRARHDVAAMTRCAIELHKRGEI